MFPLPSLAEDGFELLSAVFSRAEVDVLGTEIASTLAGVEDDAVALRSRGGIYGARNVCEICPAARNVWRRPRLVTLLRSVLGECGLVRGLFFDKPPEKSWSLPWHQDLTIAVADNRLPSRVFSKPTVKAGVAHVEAPYEVLARMLTLRIHLDDVTDENGPLRVLPGTHQAIQGDAPAVAPVTILAAAGDVLAMRPLLFHASSASAPGTMRHRRILHLEFAAAQPLPDGYAWRMFQPV